MRSLFAGTAPDQYHAFTTRLSAAGYQTQMMRVVGGCILALGLPSLLAGVVPAVTPWPGFRLLYIGIAVACVFLAAPWFRYRWPTRRESTAVVLAGTFALAGGCLATTEPTSGMLTAVAFAFVLGFAALFHSSRLMVFVITVTTLSIGWTAVRIASSHDLATSIAVTIPLVLVCVVVTFACRTIATVSSSDASGMGVDPVTGLLNRDSFYERAAALLGARNRGDDRYLVVVAITIDTLNAIAGIHGGRGSNRARVSAGQALRDTVRRGAVLGHLNDDEFVIADAFTTSDATPLGERIRGAIASTPSGITASVGVVSTALRPLDGRPPYEVLDEVIAIAADAMAQARRGGGNQVHYAFDTDLRS